MALSNQPTQIVVARAIGKLCDHIDSKANVSEIEPDDLSAFVLLLQYLAEFRDLLFDNIGTRVDGRLREEAIERRPSLAMYAAMTGAER